jgi:hypothetical protein
MYAILICDQQFTPEFIYFGGGEGIVMSGKVAQVVVF